MNGIRQLQAKDEGRWLFTQGSSVHLHKDKLPQGIAEDFGLVGKSAWQIGEWDNLSLFVLAEQADEREYVSLRSLLPWGEEKFNLLCRGVALNHFFNTHRFCGKCASPTQPAENEWAVECINEQCQYRTYPVICPSIIVAVRRGKQILLANHQRHKDGTYTTLAGFVEVGETFEQAVAREVWEETGIKVKNIRYIGSQPWAFPNSHMVGFLADYDSGEISLQEAELCDAQWFDYNQPLPKLPAKGTIALTLIETTLDICAKE